MKSWLKAELHTHTVDDPMDGGTIVRHSVYELIDRAREQGFDVLSITNHEQLLFSPSLEGYARDRGILLIPGVEATIQGKHVLLYNFRDFDPGWDSFEEIARHKGPEQLVVAPHPFFPGRTCLGDQLFRWSDLFDAIEYNHFYCSWVNFNRRGEEAARRLRVPLVGNSDVHLLPQLGCTYSLIHAERNVLSVLQAVREGQVRVVTSPVSPFFILRWIVLTSLLKSRHALGSLFGATPSKPSIQTEPRP